MTLVDLGDGEPPLDLPDQWAHDWRQRVQAAVARGQHHRALIQAATYLREGLSPANTALRLGLPLTEVQQLRAIPPPATIHPTQDTTMPPRRARTPPDGQLATELAETLHPEPLLADAAYDAYDQADAELDDAELDDAAAILTALAHGNPAPLNTWLRHAQGYPQ